MGRQCCWIRKVVLLASLECDNTTVLEHKKNEKNKKSKILPKNMTMARILPFSPKIFPVYSSTL